MIFNTMKAVLSVIAGVLSSHALATNARAWSGFSGGALINLDGEIVGVISEGYTGFVLFKRSQR